MTRYLQRFMQIMNENSKIFNSLGTLFVLFILILAFNKELSVLIRWFLGYDDVKYAEKIVEFVLAMLLLALVSISSVLLLSIPFKLFKRWPSDTDLSVSESVSATERLVATTGDTMVRDFQSRIQKEIDAAVQRLSTTSERLIKTQLAERIDATIGSDIVSILGAKLAAQTDETNQLSLLKQDASDNFVQMRNRALQYADAARRQATYFRWIGILLALGGLVARVIQTEGTVSSA